MPTQEPWFLEERAFAFASLVLTKRNDVKVQPYAGRDMAIDLLVEILKDGRPTLRFFGAQVVPYMDLPNAQNADERVLSHLGRDPFESGLPLCVFVIGVRKPEGAFRWTVEPVVEDGRPFLRRDVEVRWEALDEAGAQRLIVQVNAYYDALNGAPAPQGRARHSKAES